MASAWCDGRHVHVTGDRSVLILPGEHIRVLCAGVETRGAFYAAPGDPVLVQALSSPPEARFEVRLTPDRMQAQVRVIRRIGVDREVLPAEPANPLRLRTEIVREVPPPPVSPGEVLMALADLGVQVPVDQTALVDACAAGTGEWVTVATGTYPTPPAATRLRRVLEPFVAEGQAAFVLEPDPGKPGLTVTGEAVPPRAGRGQPVVYLSPHLRRGGDRYIASAAGYPWSEPPFFGFTPFLSPHRLEARTLIRRRLHVPGILFVDGDVVGCEVTCAGLVVTGALIRSRVTAVLPEPVAAVEQLCRDLRRLEAAAAQILQRPETQDVSPASLIAVLLRTRFRAVLEAALGQTVPPDAPFGGIWHRAAEMIASWSDGAGSPLAVRSVRLLLTPLLGAWSLALGGAVRAESIQDTRIAGPLRVDAGEIRRSIVAAQRQVTADWVRGGRIQGAAEIRIGDLGDPDGTPTLVDVAPGGWASAERVHPGAVLTAGSRRVAPASTAVRVRVADPAGS